MCEEQRRWRGGWGLVATVALLLALAASAGGSNATLRATLNTWSKKVGADAHSVALAAQRRHSVRMTSSGANRFHRDALRAWAAVAAQKPSTANGRQARQLALTGLADHARAGSKWAACGRARVAHHRAASIGYSKVGANYGHTGNKLLVAAGKLLNWSTTKRHGEAVLGSTAGSCSRRDNYLARPGGIV